MATKHYLEWTDFLRRQNRRFHFVLALQGVVVLLVCTVGFMVLARPTPVIMFQEGQPSVIMDTFSPQERVDALRVKSFTEAFVKRYVAVDPLRNSEEFSEALNLLSDEQRKIVLSNPGEVERRKSYVEQMLRTKFVELDVHHGELSGDYSERPLAVRAIGKMTTQPVVGGADIESAAESFAYVELLIRQVNINPVHIWGLEIASIHYEIFSSKAELEAHILKRDGV